jgi:DNA-binding IclR family transcriptional regulator
MSAAKRSSGETIVAVLEAKRDATVSDIAAAAGLGRSTVGKVLARLERAGRVHRSPGRHEGGRRLPDRWATGAPKRPARGRARGKRLRPRELDGLVLDYLAKHAQSDPLSPAAIASGLGRSAGAVGNCLTRLTGAGRVRQVSKQPRRYQPV